PDVEEMLRRAVREQNLDFDRALNDMLRTALSSGVRGAGQRFRQTTYSLGSERVDLTKSRSMADELEDEEIIRKMKLPGGDRARHEPADLFGSPGFALARQRESLAGRNHFRNRTRRTRVECAAGLHSRAYAIHRPPGAAQRERRSRPGLVLAQSARSHDRT